MNDNGKYNGFANYETWAVCLWIDNEEGSQEYVRELALEILENNNGFREKSRYDMAEALKIFIYDFAPELPPSLYSDLLNASLSSVDWYEVAEHFLEV